MQAFIELLIYLYSFFTHEKERQEKEEQEEQLTEKRSLKRSMSDDCMMRKREKIEF